MRLWLLDRTEEKAWLSSAAAVSEAARQQPRILMPGTSATTRLVVTKR